MTDRDVVSRGSEPTLWPEDNGGDITTNPDLIGKLISVVTIYRGLMHYRPSIPPVPPWGDTVTIALELIDSALAAFKAETRSLVVDLTALFATVLWKDGTARLNTMAATTSVTISSSTVNPLSRCILRTSTF
ncbi:hypothetical protein ULG90_11440 [Halopseudomonas pachastrellae]|nr:hypothetical protein ULG90_11440 [Halopseudomonas pachastrellae]